MEALERLRELAAWLAPTDIGLLDLRGPQMHLRLRRDGGTLLGEVVQVNAGNDAPTASGYAADDRTKTANSFGVFPAARGRSRCPGADMRAGQRSGCCNRARCR
jgi:acetyl-CoA carboxylase biotin carboxyl carrier protein